MPDTPDLSHPLDERQITMLGAMGIRVFQPAFLEQHPAPPPTEYTKIATKLVASENPSPIPKPAASHTPAQPDSIGSSRAEGIAHMGWGQLQAAVQDCQACGLCQSRKNTVFGIGAPPAPEAPPNNPTPQADWLIVGEAPGENEDLQGEPFVGQAGKLLDNMLAAMKVGQAGKSLSRTHNVYIANVLKCRPPANRNPSPEEVAQCEPYLLRQIELLQPKLILAMGRFAITTLTGSADPVGKLRGRIHRAASPRITAPIIVTYHPAYLLRNLPDKAKAWADLVLAMQTMKGL